MPHTLRARPRSRWPLLLLLPLLNGCAAAPPGTGGAPGVAPRPDRPWLPPASLAAPVSAPDRDGGAPGLAMDAIPDTLANLTLARVVDIALANSPVTRAAWAQAKAAAAGYGIAKGDRYPTLDGTVSATRADDGNDVWETAYGPGAALSWRLLDFGGRGGRVEAARQTMLAASFTHNATLQDAILAVESAYYRHGGAQALLEATRMSLAAAESSVVAAESRHDVGLATIADVLQARTARAQAELDVLTYEGQVRSTKGALAVSMGLPANLPYDVAVDVPAVPLDVAAQDAAVRDVEILIARAVATRPDLRAAQAAAEAARARAGAASADLWPSLSLSGSTRRTWTDGQDDYEDRASGSVILSVPLFDGFTDRHTVARARAEADAAAERARGLRQQVVYEIFVAQSDFQTATQRVRAVDELLASATRSEEVARGRYREGVGDILDLLSAQRVLAEARAQNVNARLGWFVALAQLARDAGVLGLHGDNPLAPGNLQPEVER